MIRPKKTFLCDTNNIFPPSLFATSTFVRGFISTDRALSAVLLLVNVATG